jgi:hypothetical protein
MTHCLAIRADHLMIQRIFRLRFLRLIVIGHRYLKSPMPVAERLLEQAAPIDKGIQKIYSVEVIP